jgi:hypothetical protein
MIKIKQQFWEKIMEIKDNNKINEFDYHQVLNYVYENGDYDLGGWLYENQKKYQQGVMFGFAIKQ